MPDSALEQGIHLTMKNPPVDSGRIWWLLTVLAFGLVQSQVFALPGAGSALHYDGINGYVQVAHNPNLNSFPFTVTAWFRTTNTANVVSGIVSKYVNDSGTGWFLILRNGSLRGYYSRSIGNQAMDAT